VVPAAGGAEFLKTAGGGGGGRICSTLTPLCQDRTVPARPPHASTPPPTEEGGKQPNTQPLPVCFSRILGNQQFAR